MWRAAYRIHVSRYPHFAAYAMALVVGSHLFITEYDLSAPAIFLLTKQDLLTAKNYLSIAPALLLKKQLPLTVEYDLSVTDTLLWRGNFHSQQNMIYPELISVHDRI